MKKSTKSSKAKLEKYNLDAFSSYRPHGYSPSGPLVLSDLRVLNTLPNVPGGQVNLMSVRTLYQEGVRCALDMWVDTAPFPGSNPDELQIYINNVPYGERVEFRKPLSTLTWPYTFTITEGEIGEHGLKNLSYEVFTSAGGNDRPATPTPVTIDRLDPNARLISEAPILEDWVGPTLTVEDLAAHGNQLTVTIPGRLDPQVGDLIMVFWGYPTPNPIYNGAVPNNRDPFPVTLTAAQILDQGPGLKYITYRYNDRAGNVTSFPSELTQLMVSTQPSPSNLTPPRVPAAPLDLKDAQQGLAEVFLDGYTNALIGDDVQIEFNGQIILHTLTSPVWPQRVQIPWDVLRAGGLDAPYSADVRYRVVRDGVPSVYSATITVDVDLTSAGGRPEDPGPVNPDLGLIEVESSQGLINIIGPGDTGDATARFDVYAGAMQGHRIQIYWDGMAALTPAYTVTPDDESATQFELPIPASVIATRGNGRKDVWYELNNGVNNNVISSLATSVQVDAASVENLEPIRYLDAHPIGGGFFVLTCDQGVTSGIRTTILDTVNLRVGDVVTLHWVVYGPDDLTSDTVVVDHTFPPVTVLGNHNVPGYPGELFTVPFPVFIEPVIAGRIEAYYTVLKADGVTGGTADPTIVYLNRRRADSTICT